MAAKTEPSKSDLLAKIAQSDDWRASAWLVERLEREPETGEDGIDEVARKRKARRTKTG